MYITCLFANLQIRVDTTQQSFLFCVLTKLCFKRKIGAPMSEANVFIVSISVSNACTNIHCMYYVSLSGSKDHYRKT